MKRITMSIITFLVFSLIFNGYTKQRGRPELKSMLKKGIIDCLHAWSPGATLGDGFMYLSSSYLPPEGTEPNPNKYPTKHKDINYMGDMIEYDKKYSQYSIHDGDVSTVWAEGAKGPGIGEVVFAEVDLSKSIWIWAGNGASQNYFLMNNRPKEIRLIVLASSGFGACKDSQGYLNVKVLSSHTITLKDYNGYQKLELPQGNYTGAKRPFIAIEILSVYKGTRYDDTCISEIKNE